MRNDQLDDLKDLYRTTMDSSKSNLTKLIKATEFKLSEDIAVLGKEVKDGFIGVADTLEKTIVNLMDDLELLVVRLDKAT
jgi:hypothetical protein